MKRTSSVLVLILSFVMAASAQTAETPENVSLTFIWHAGSHADLLQKMAEEYTKETGVEIHAILPPLSQEYYQRVADEFAKNGDAFDLCIYDSQYMSEFAFEDHIVKLNEWLRNSTTIHASDFDPTALKQYAEFPEDSGNVYALPINEDCMGLVYRKDLFANTDEQAAFKEKFGYSLGKPQTYDQLRDIAEFFTRPDQNLYGIALSGSADDDACSSAFLNLFWSFGAELWDPKMGTVGGYVNSPQAKKALAFFKQLFDFAPPDFRDADVNSVNRAVVERQAVLGIQWYSAFKSFAAASDSAKEQLGFATLPGQKDEAGVFHQFVTIGGQLISISQYSKHKEEAWKFVEWLLAKEQQWKWVDGGGVTGLSAILGDSRFLDASPANRTFPASMRITKDYWHVPSSRQLLKILQDSIHSAITGKLSPDEALDECAKKQEKILRDALSEEQTD